MTVSRRRRRRVEQRRVVGDVVEDGLDVLRRQAQRRRQDVPRLVDAAVDGEPARRLGEHERDAQEQRHGRHPRARRDDAPVVRALRERRHDAEADDARDEGAEADGDFGVGDELAARRPRRKFGDVERVDGVAHAARDPAQRGADHDLGVRRGGRRETEPDDEEHRGRREGRSPAERVHDETHGRGAEYREERRRGLVQRDLEPRQLQVLLQQRRHDRGVADDEPERGRVDRGAHRIQRDARLVRLPIVLHAVVVQRVSTWSR
mmetsp:Transcript_14543/g.58042  ORF Transcript_14543/g.58042 Transcript_14543/m.58042 type:complete len:263 (-) Transcript_14543:129-917(-)